MGKVYALSLSETSEKVVTASKPLNSGYFDPGNFLFDFSLQGSSNQVFLEFCRNGQFSNGFVQCIPEFGWILKSGGLRKL